MSLTEVIRLFRRMSRETLHEIGSDANLPTRQPSLVNAERTKKCWRKV